MITQVSHKSFGLNKPLDDARPFCGVVWGHINGGHSICSELDGQMHLLYQNIKDSYLRDLNIQSKFYSAFVFIFKVHKEQIYISKHIATIHDPFEIVTSKSTAMTVLEFRTNMKSSKRISKKTDSDYCRCNFSTYLKSVFHAGFLTDGSL